jgi:hypothetical protein
VDWGSCNVYGSIGIKNRVRNVVGTKVIDFCENNVYEMGTENVAPREEGSTLLLTKKIALL